MVVLPLILNDEDAAYWQDYGRAIGVFTYPGRKRLPYPI